MAYLNVKKIHPDAVVPAFSREGDGCFDITSVETKTLMPGERHAFATGFSAAFPVGYVLIFKDRSGMALKHGIHALAGVIDPHYRGEYKVLLVNLGSEPYEIKKGDRIVQALLIKNPEFKIEEVEELDMETTRGEGGFGSSGR